MGLNFCQMCGALENESWETDTRRRIILSCCSRSGDPFTTWMICNECNEGLQNTALPKPDRIHLFGQIRRATLTDQEAVLAWLLKKFDLVATKTA